MPIIESRLRTGVLTVDAVAFNAQATNVRLVPSTSTQGDPVEVLSGDKIGADEVTAWALEFTGIQDFDDADGWIEFARANAGETVAFTFEPNNDGAPTYAGTATVRAVTIGGPVNARLTSDASWPVVTGPTPTYPTP